KIAKRIEEGINQVLEALACYPGTIESLLNSYQAVTREELKLSDIIIGFNDTEEYPDSGQLPPEIDAEAGSSVDEDEEDEEEDSDSSDGDDEPEAVLDPEEVRSHIEAIEKIYSKLTRSIKRNGRHHKKSQELQNELCQAFLS